MTFKTKIEIILITLFAVVGFGSFSLSAPSYTPMRDIWPEITNTYNIGTTTKQWLNLFAKNITATGTTTLATTTINVRNSHLATDGSGTIIATTTPILTETDPIWTATSSNYFKLSSWYATTTDGLDEGLTNKYYLQSRVWADLLASSTYPAYVNYWIKNGSDLGYTGGKIGIGTTTPQNNLHVYASTTSGVSQRIENGANDDVILYFKNPTKQYQMQLDGDGSINGTNSLHIYDSTLGASRLTVSSATGYVGIGSTTPTSLLSVGASGLQADGSGNTTSTGKSYVGSLVVNSLSGWLNASSGLVSASTSPYLSSFSYGNATGTNLNISSNFSLGSSFNLNNFVAGPLGTYPYFKFNTYGGEFGNRAGFFEDRIYAVALEENPVLGFIDGDGDGMAITFVTSTNAVTFIGGSSYTFGNNVAVSGAATTTGKQYVGSLQIGSLGGFLYGTSGNVTATTSPYFATFGYGNATGTNLSLSGNLSVSGTVSPLNVNGNVTSTAWYIGSGSDYLKAYSKSLGIFGNAYFLNGRGLSGIQPGVGIDDSLTIMDNGLPSPGITFIKSDLSISKSIIADLDNNTLNISFNTTTLNILDAGTIYADNFKPSYMEVLNNLQVNENITGFGLTGLGGYADTDYRLAIYSNNVGSLRIASSTAEILHIAGNGIFDWNPNNENFLDFQVEGDTDPYALYVYSDLDNVGVGTSTPSKKLSVAGTGEFVTGNTTNAIMHIGEQVNEGGWFVSTIPSQLIMTGGADYVGTSWTARDTTASMIRLQAGTVVFSSDSGLTAGSTFYPTARMTILSSGYVGIGTSTPSTLFQVHDSAATSTVFISSGAVAKGGRVILEDTDGAGCTQITALNGVLSASIVACP